jgi:hypothetical protein
MAKVGSQIPFSRLWAGLYFLSLVWRLRKIKNPKNPVNPVNPVKKIIFKSAKVLPKNETSI